ncbi:sterile alpha motif domain containing 11 [Elysia marginata]|uniref:Sterile alpha motif domain containing 11 n=1 Tax=Elysia marginata TaxID=1093978 RepID=A0AAV4H369_9GAST|nr:sterile alpha motif domain containing 11 [Elysia marginata]
MKKRSRRAKGRVKKAAAPAVQPENEETSGGLSEEISPHNSLETAVEGDGRKRRGCDVSPTYDAVNGAEAGDSDSRTVPSVKISTVKTGSGASGNKIVVNNITTIPTIRSSSCSNSNSSMDEPGNGGVSDGDGDGDGETEPMHSGFMQNGPKNYRVGSTVVNLNNCSEEDVSPEFRHRDICLQVECGDNTGLMYMSKLYQGSKGKCIQVENAWYTPNEFQAVSGRESAKDWKRSIRHQGRSLKLLLSRNVLDVHPAACRCDSCQQLQLMVSTHITRST